MPKKGSKRRRAASAPKPQAQPQAKPLDLGCHATAFAFVLHTMVSVFGKKAVSTPAATDAQSDEMHAFFQKAAAAAIAASGKTLRPDGDMEVR